MMNPEKKMLKKLTALALVIGTAVAVGPSAAQADGGTVSGTVTTTDGAPLADVEVFLWVLAGDPSGPRYTCTDASGAYSFDGVDQFLMVATGPEVYPAEHCDNPGFFDYRTRPTSALLVEFDTHFPDGAPAPATVDLVVSSLPGSLPQLDRLATNAMKACWVHGNANAYSALMANYDRLLDRLADRVDPADADLYTWFSASITPIFDLGVVCPPGTA